MVRLRLDKHAVVFCKFFEFQFHYGAIKTAGRFRGLPAAAQFQFHYGAIKT